MCFFALRHAMVVESEWGVGQREGGAGQPPYDRWGLPPSSRSLAHMSWVGVGGWKCLSHWLCCHATSMIHVMLHSSLWCWTDLGSVVEKAWRTSPTDQWHGRGRWCTGWCPCGFDRCGQVGPRPPATSTCLLCPFSSLFCTIFAIILAYK
jgi:hypothetical protein